jgi:hypothetical protein
MPVLRFYSSIASPTTLSGSISAGATSITVGATTGFPTSVPYTLALDYGAATEELVDVTAVAGTTLTVTRGVDGTSAQSHSLGAVVRHVASGRDFADYQTHQAASSAIHGVTGTLVGTSDTQTLSNKTLSSPTINSGAVSGTFTGAATWSGLQTINGGVASSGNIGTSAQFTGTGSAIGQDVFRGLVSGDAQNRFTIDADGRLEWGTGASGRDTDLFRNGVGILQTASRISAQRGTSTELAFHTQLQADTGSRWYIQSGGTLNWGDGAGAVDTNLYRSAANTLKTDDALVVTGNLTAANIATGAATSYTPTWTSSGGTTSVGDGVLEGYHLKQGRDVLFWIRLQWGGTTSSTGTEWMFALPFAVATTSANANTLYPVQAWAFDFSTNNRYMAFGYVNQSGQNVQQFTASGTATAWDQADPFTFASGDRINIWGSYEAAS